MKKNKLWDIVFTFSRYPTNICQFPYYVIAGLLCWLGVVFVGFLLLGVALFLPLAALNIYTPAEPTPIIVSFMIWAFVAYITALVSLVTYRKNNKVEREPSLIAQYIKAKKDKVCLDIEWHE